MTARERQGWYIVASLFVTLLVIFGGGLNTLPVLIPALLKGFPNWSRAQVSLLSTVLAVSAGISVLPVGWLVDRIEARVVMIAGALSLGGGFILASLVNSFWAMLGIYALAGFGIAAGTVLPASLVLANWFTEKRGRAMGIAISGTTVGGMVMTLVAGGAAQHWGWRAAYLALAAPMLLVAIPILLIGVRSRPPGTVVMTVAQGAETLEGFEIAEAVHTRSFWLITVAQFCFAFAAGGAMLHVVQYLDDLGYAPNRATLAASLIFGFAAIGKIAMGLLADRISGRFALGLNFSIQAFALVLAFGLAHVPVVIIFVVVFGLTLGAPLMLIPLVIAESLGLKRYGSISGLTAIANTSGLALGPTVAGLIFDHTHSYAAAFELFIAIYALGAIVSFSCRSYADERSRVPIESGAVAAHPVSS
jgi:MFS family permease